MSRDPSKIRPHPARTADLHAWPLPEVWADFSLVTLETEINLSLPQSPALSHIVGLSSCQNPRQTKTFLSDRIFQEPGEPLLVAKGKGQTALKVQLILYCTRTTNLRESCGSRTEHPRFLKALWVILISQIWKPLM